MQVLYKIVTLKKKCLILYCEISAVIWIILMFCFNYDAQTAWLCARITQAERDRIVTNFINNNKILQMLISTHQVKKFKINLQSNCSCMIIIKLSWNLNILLQIQTHLVRINQNKKVKIWILFTNHNFQCWWIINLAHKTISDLSIQLVSKLIFDKKADIQMIEHHEKQTLNIIMNWYENWAN